MRPERLSGMQASSVKKKLKAKGFAAGDQPRRHHPRRRRLGVELDEHIQFVIDAMSTIADDLELSPPPATAP